MKISFFFHISVFELCDVLLASSRMRYLGFALILLTVAACTESAPHSNPLDPDSPQYSTTGALSGRVMTFYQPFQPIAGATVTLEPVGEVVRSNASGFFTFTGLEPDTFVVTISADGFAGINDTVAVLPRTTVSRDYHLNGLPFMLTSRIISSRVATREAATPRIFLDIQATLHDPDGANDIQRVLLSIPSQAFVDTLAPAIGAGQWQRLFVPEELANLDIGKLVGVPFRLIIQDKPGAEVTSEAFFMARLISEEPEAIAPVNGDASESAPTFRWQLPNITYSYTQKLEVFRLDAGFPTLVTTISRIKPEVRSSPYLGRLSAGSYFWTLHIVDDFGNSSRSKEASFVVQ